MKYSEVLTSDIAFSDRRQIIVLTDKKHPDIRYIANNPARYPVCAFCIDGGLLKNEQKKCDKLLVVEKPQQYPDFYFIELKGQDVERAIKQLSQSVKAVIDDCTIDYHSVNCRLVMSKCPDFRSSDRIKLERKLKDMNGSFKRQSRQLEETI